MSEQPAHEILKRVFDVVVKEAKNNPIFADKMLQALPPEMVVKAKAKGRPKKEQLFDVSKYHAVNILRRYDVGVLEGRLYDLTKDNLKTVAKYSGLRLTGPAGRKSATKAMIVKGIVDAAKHYIEQRKSAAA